MGKRRRKNRTHLKGQEKGETEEKGPKSFVIKSGNVTKSIAQLVRDTRKLMEPNTATRLRERPHARLRDYLSIAPTLNVTHLMAFTLTEASNVHMRVARLPQGPTLTFRVQRYSLMKDLVNASMRNVGKAPGGEYRNPPLLVLNNFQQPAGSPVLPQLRLLSTMFQGLFPPIQVEKSALPTFRRVLLISYSHTTHLISMRHFTISVRPHGVSRRVRKLLNPLGPSSSSSSARRAPNLSSTDDIADYLLRRSGTSGTPSEGYESMSETDASEAESDTNAVELPEDYVGRGNRKGERKAVRLVETGPRLELRLIKVVEGLVGSKKGEGETVFHEFVHKTKADVKAQNQTHAEKRAIKAARRAEQEANVARKKALLAKSEGANEDGADEDVDDDEDLDVEGLSDVDLDPEEALEKRSSKGKAKNVRLDQGGLESDDDEDEDEEEFGYEDRGAAGQEDDEESEGDWDDEVDAGDVSSEEEGEEDEEDGGASSEDEDARPAPPRPRPTPSSKASGKKRRS